MRRRRAAHLSWHILAVLKGNIVPTLRLLPVALSPNGHGGEVFSCAYTLDGAYVLSGGWDGHLRLWEAGSGTQLTGFRAGNKPISACAIAPDNMRWLSGSLDGMLATWDAKTQQCQLTFLAHTRPISSIVFDSDGLTLATASWDRTLTLWRPDREREGRQLTGHQDIVAGCRFTPDGKSLLSWSHDGSLRLWDTANARLSGQLPGHEHKVTAAAVSPDGRLAASAARDGALRLWDLLEQRELAAARIAYEVRACFFLLDGESLLTVEANGRLALHSAATLQEQHELHVRLPLQCAALAPSGSQVAIGCDDGKVRFLAVDGLECAPLLVTPTRTSHRTSTMLGRLFGKSKLEHAYACTCPACRQSFQLTDAYSGKPSPCPHCRRPLRFSTATRVVPEK
jgi:WD40 repeat protein